MSEYDCFRCNQTNHVSDLYPVGEGNLEELVCKDCIKPEDKLAKWFVKLREFE